MSHCHFFQVIDRLSNHFDYDLYIGSVPRKKLLKKTITELGVCETFNSKLSPYFAPDFIINNTFPASEPSIEINFHDDFFIYLPDVDDSYVNYLI